MEKTKKLFAYAVVFVAIVSLFFAGISMQSLNAYADLSPNTDVSTKVNEATDLDGNSLEGIVIIFAEDATVSQNQLIVKAKDDAVQGNFSKAILEEIDEVAKIVSGDNEVDHGAIVYAKPFIIKNIYEPAKVTFSTKDIPDVVDFVLFRGLGADDDWEVITLEDTTSGASNAPGQPSITVKLPGDGTVLFAHFSQKKADEIKASKTGEDKACCDDCKNCPFCSFLCKDGKCYCWTAYVVIALVAVLIVLLVALIVVKAKANKVVDVQAQPVEPVEDFEEKNPEDEENK